VNIIFAGTPDFSVAPLSALIASGHTVIAVYTQPDRPSGRGRKLTPSPVKALALKHDIPVYQPVDFKHDDDIKVLQSLNSDLMVVVAYGLILPQIILDAPKQGCINIHASLLPRWRGAAPIHRAILAGDQSTGITIMQMAAGLDTGPMLHTVITPIAPDETSAGLHDRLAEIGAIALMECLSKLSQITPKEQDHQQTNYAHKLVKSEATIDWTQSAIQIDRQIRAFNAWPVAQTSYLGKVLRLWHSQVTNETSQLTPGTIIQCQKDGIDVATGEGVVRLLQLQMPGKRAMQVADFINAHSLEGASLG